MALTIFVVSIVVLLFVSTLFILGILLERNDIADVGWAIGIMLSAVIALGINATKGPLVSLLLALVLVWSLRLSVRVFLRNAKKSEDYRYDAWRKKWSGRWFQTRTYLQIYFLQGVLMILVAAPLINASLVGDNEELNIFSYLGGLIWLIGFAFEAIGDYQLDEFTKNPRNKGKIMMSGLWRFSRHPNYFGEISMWWGIWLIVFPLPFSMLALIGPVTITYLILKVSGVPALESKWADDKEWEIYKANTSVLVPLPTHSKIGQILIGKLN